MPIGGNERVVLQKYSFSNRWLGRGRAAVTSEVENGAKKGYNSFESSMRVAVRYYRYPF